MFYNGSNLGRIQKFILDPDIWIVVFLLVCLETVTILSFGQSRDESHSKFEIPGKVLMEGNLLTGETYNYMHMSEFEPHLEIAITPNNVQ